MDSDRFTLVDFLRSEAPDLFAKARAFGDFLEDWKGKGTYSYHRTVTSACGARTTIRDRDTGESREMIVLASNNYLGLSTRPEVVLAAAGALARYGTSLCGSRFLSGTYDLLEQLEARIAAFEHFEAAVVFTSGYQANVGTLSALLRPHDVAFIDRLCHASIVDGCRLAGCDFHTFRHNDMAHLEVLLAESGGSARGRLVVVEGVFSMDGDTAPLPRVVELAQRYEAKILVDEAHATGVLGANGRGSVELHGLDGQVDIVLGTFSKALAATGGFIAASRDVVDYVRHYGRSYMFSASPTPAVAASILAALDIVEAEPLLRERLWNNVRFLHQGLAKMGFSVFPSPAESAIVTVPVGPDTTVRAMSKRLYELGLFASTVAYPAVPRDEGRIRLSLSAAHTLDDLNDALDVLHTVGREFGLVA